MLILFDHGTPKGLARAEALGHEVENGGHLLASHVELLDDLGSPSPFGTASPGTEGP